MKKRTDMQPAAVIFDLDDTLAATGPLWKRAETTLLNALGASWSPDLAAQYKGMNTLDVAAVIHRKLDPKMSLKECQDLMRNTLLALYEDEPPPPMAGAVDCVRQLDGRFPLAVASGSPLEGIERILKRFGITDCFEIRISSESVALGKPHPDVFIAAAEQLGVAPADCVVFEDSLVGAQAARAAGMTSIVIPSSENAEIAQVADYMFASLEDVDFDSLCMSTARNNSLVDVPPEQ